MQRKGSAIWQGDLKTGKGTVSTDSGVLSQTQYSFATRFESGKGTNPEELIAAAHDPRVRRTEEKKLISVEPLRIASSGFFDSRTGLAVAALVLLVAGGGALSLFVDRWNSPVEVRKQSNANVPGPVVPAPVAAIEKAAVSETAKVVPTLTTDPHGNLMLNIEATEKTWIEVTADGKRIFMGVMEPGDKKLISTLQNTKMVVGNAGGIAVSKGGRDIGPIGPRGQVRTVNITEKGVEIVEPKKPTDAI